MAGSPEHRGTFTHRNLLPSRCEIVVNQCKYIILLQLYGSSSFQTKNPDQDLSDLIDDCERFVLRSFDGVKQSAMHIYHSALSWTPTSSSTRQLYEGELITETKVVNAVGPTWDTCIRIIPVALRERVKRVVFSPSGALIAANGESCVQVFDAVTGVNRATFDGDMFLCVVAFSPDDGFLASGLWGMTINVWDVQMGTIVQAFQWTIRSAPFSVAFSSCSTMIASGTTDGTVRIWNLLSGHCDCVFQGHSGIVRNVCWLPTRNQVVCTSDDHTVRIWDVQTQTCSKIFAQYSDTVVALASSPGLLLMASKNGTVNIYDSQSGGIIHVIKSNNITHPRISADGGKVLLASEKSGDIWDITTNMLSHVGSIEYNGEQATFSPDGTRVASIYGKFLKIWKTDTGYNNHEGYTHVHNTIDGIYISPDEWQVMLVFKMGANILDATTGQCLFTYPVTDILSIGVSLDIASVAFLKHHGKVEIWNAQTHHKSIKVDADAFYIALSPNGSQLASLSSYHMQLWDLRSDECLACLKFHKRVEKQARVLFSADATSISILDCDDMESWRISASHPQTRSFKTIVFVRIPKQQSNQDASAPRQSYRCDIDDEWILDEDGRRILWIPPDERPRGIFGGFKREKKVLVQTESGKVYFVNFSQS